MYSAETWTLKAEHVRRLTMFHNHCMRTILGVTRYQQWEQRLISKTLANRFGMDWLILDKRMQWLGDLGRIGDGKLPKGMPFGELRKKKACHGTKKRWRDQMSGDLQVLGLRESWYVVCEDRKE